MPEAKDNPVTLEGAELGRFLFYDPILSFDSTFSCASCHRQEQAFSTAPERYSKGISGMVQQRNTLPLFNLAWYQAYFWDGRTSSIESQVFHPIRDKNEMNLDWITATLRIGRSKFYKQKFLKAFGNSKIDSVLISKAIAQFERTLISNDSKYDRVIKKYAKYTMEEVEGMELVNDMTKASCMHCHTTDGDGLGTTGKFSNNGLDAAGQQGSFPDRGLGKITNIATDNGKFKIPSLRNLLFTAPYMHDGRFQTLEEVLDFYSEGIKLNPTIDSKMEFAHKGGAKLTPAEKKKIILFLYTMSDSSFIAKNEYSNPFLRAK